MSSRLRTGRRPVRRRVASVRDTSPGFQPFGFQGGLYDPDTGLVEFGCRWYDAEAGRWISKDPIGLEGGWNLYEFCSSEPIDYHDYDGCGKVKLAVKTVKGLNKVISRISAKKVLHKGGSVNVEGVGVNKQAKRLAEEVSGQRIVRHEPHQEGWHTHYQPKNGGFHVNVPGYNFGVMLFGDNIFGWTADFINPLSDVQELIDLGYQLFGESEVVK